MSQFVEKLRENYLAVESRIQKACERSGRDRSDVTLVAVTKYAKLEWVQALLEMGQLHLGENRPQQLVERADKVDVGLVCWHLIGHLQSNKVKSIVRRVGYIHSVDSLKLLELIDRQASQAPWHPNVLLEVNVTGEATKYGFTPDELRTHWNSIVACQQFNLCGLMTMAAASDDPETTRPAFQALRELRDELRSQSPPVRHPFLDLSMGMTGDFEVAIEEGATFVRIGSALFDGLE